MATDSNSGRDSRPPGASTAKLMRTRHEVRVDVDFAKLVFDDRDAAAVLPLQDAV